MATDHSTDRDAFGHWLSGFVDGEGCFQLAWAGEGPGPNHRSPNAMLSICLRHDDVAILEEIQAYWNVGYVRHRPGRIRENPPTIIKPACTFRVGKLKDITEVILPHFERYPLRAKKKRDFIIWKKAVELMIRVHQKPFRRKRRWSVQDILDFGTLFSLIKEQRKA